MLKIPDGYQDRTVFTKREVADMLQISERKVDYMIDEGKIDIIDLGHRTIRIPREEIEKL